MCVWNLALKNRHCEWCSYRGGCETFPENALFDAETYRKLMEDVLGASLLQRTRQHDIVWGRYMVARQMELSGFSVSVAGRSVGLDRTTVIRSRKLIKDMFEYPSIYKHEMTIWSDYQNKLNSYKKRT